MRQKAGALGSVTVPLKCADTDLIDSFYLGPSVQQQLDNIHTPFVCSVHQRCLASLAAVINQSDFHFISLQQDALNIKYQRQLNCRKYSQFNEDTLLTHTVHSFHLSTTLKLRFHVIEVQSRL
jgi:hypothetical protein